ncbi:MAG: LPS export ABC transporter periplasmic protein LptC [Formosimonas sp.]
MSKPSVFSRWRYWTRFHLPALVYVSLLLAAAAGSYWWIKQDKPSKSVPEKHPELVDAFAQGLTINRTNKDGSVGYVLTAQDILHYGSQDGTVKTVSLVATPVGQPPMTAVANDGEWSDEKHTIRLTGQVKLTRAGSEEADEMVLLTEGLDVDLYNGLARTTLPFKLTQGKSEMTGTGFEYDYQLRNLTLKSTAAERIKAVVYGREIKK